MRRALFAAVCVFVVIGPARATHDADPGGMFRPNVLLDTTQVIDRR